MCVCACAWVCDKWRPLDPHPSKLNRVVFLPFPEQWPEPEVLCWGAQVSIVPGPSADWPNLRWATSIPNHPRATSIPQPPKSDQHTPISVERPAYPNLHWATSIPQSPLSAPAYPNLHWAHQHTPISVEWRTSPNLSMDQPQSRPAQSPLSDKHKWIITDSGNPLKDISWGQLLCLGSPIFERPRGLPNGSCVLLWYPGQCRSVCLQLTGPVCIRSGERSQSLLSPLTRSLSWTTLGFNSGARVQKAKYIIQSTPVWFSWDQISGGVWVLYTWNWMWSFRGEWQRRVAKKHVGSNPWSKVQLHNRIQWNNNW